jgi:3-phosphoshikimate 1-carboxyvinyltransferase
MQSLKLNSGLLFSEVQVPPSKSYANRALVLASLSSEEVTLKNLPQATDVTILIDCLRRLGLIIESSLSEITIRNSFPQCETTGCEIQVGEGGTTARFLASMLLLGAKPYKLILGNRLKKRPWEEFIQLASSLGAKVSLKESVLSIQGPVNWPDMIEIDCSNTTQFATGFQLLSGVTKSVIRPVNLNSSESYWKMTEKIFEELRTNRNYTIPADWSSASYPLAFAALNQKIHFPGLMRDHFQADAKFYDVLKHFGALEDTDHGINISPVTRHESYTFNVADALDLVPTLAFFLSHIEGTHVLQNVQNLVYKESDRLKEVIDLLTLFGRKTISDGTSLTIEGSTSRSKAKIHLSLPDDHRMVMVGTLFLLHHGGGSVTPSEAVKKSYPGFFDLIPELSSKSL